MFSLNVLNENVSIRGGKINCVCNKSLKQNRICFSNKVVFLKKKNKYNNICCQNNKTFCSVNKKVQQNANCSFKKTNCISNTTVCYMYQNGPNKMHLVIITMTILCVI